MSDRLALLISRGAKRRKKRNVGKDKRKSQRGCEEGAGMKGTADRDGDALEAKAMVGNGKANMERSVVPVNTNESLANQ